MVGNQENRIGKLAFIAKNPFEILHPGDLNHLRLLGIIPNFPNNDPKLQIIVTSPEIGFVTSPEIGFMVNNIVVNRKIVFVANHLKSILQIRILVIPTKEKKIGDNKYLKDKEESIPKKIFKIEKIIIEIKIEKIILEIKTEKIISKIKKKIRKIEKIIFKNKIIKTKRNNWGAILIPRNPKMIFLLAAIIPRLFLRRMT